MKTTAEAPPSARDWLAGKQNSRLPTRLATWIGIGCQAFTLPSSVDHDCDEGYSDTTTLSYVAMIPRSRREVKQLHDGRPQVPHVVHDGMIRLD